MKNINLYQLENHRVKITLKNGNTYYGDVLLVLSPEDTTEGEVCVNIEVKNKHGSYAGYAIYESEIQSVEVLD